MKRVLYSQHETNMEEDYLLVDGKIVTDQELRNDYVRSLTDVKKYRKLYSDEYITIYKQGHTIIINSIYSDKDVVGRHIFYSYLVENVDDYDRLLDQLEADSKLINRSFDRKRIEELIVRIKDEKAKSKIFWIIAAIVGIALFTVLLKKAI